MPYENLSPSHCHTIPYAIYNPTPLCSAVSMIDTQIEKEAKAKPEPGAQLETPAVDPTKLEAEAKQREVDARAEMLRGVL